MLIYQRKTDGLLFRELHNYNWATMLKTQKAGNNLMHFRRIELKTQRWWHLRPRWKDLTHTPIVSSYSINQFTNAHDEHMFPHRLLRLFRGVSS